MNLWLKYRLRLVFIVVIAVMLTTPLLVSLVSKRANATTVTQKSALVYGDSLTWESYWQIQSKFATKTNWTFQNFSFPDTAPCDWLTRLPNDLATYQPTVVAITTAGNASSCVKDADGNSLDINTAGYYAKYEQDINSMFSQITATGAKVIFFKAPPFTDPARNAAVPKIFSIAKTLAANYHGISVSGAIFNALSTNSKYASYKACLTTETAAMGCSGGKIPIRTLTGTQAGLHLCPAGLPADLPWFCLAYSSGEFRFGNALVNTVFAPPAPILP